MIKFALDRIRRVFAFIAVYYYVKRKTNFNGVTRSDNVETYLWLPKFSWRYYINEKIILDYGKINALSEAGIKFKIIKSHKIGRISNKTVHLNYSDMYNWHYGFSDYTRSLHFLVEQLESQGNKVFPSSKEIFYWENKGFMHKKFKEYNISEPQTELCNNIDEVKKLNWEYPFLIKEEHSSASAGVHKVNSKADLDTHNANKTFKPNEFIIVQKLVNMRRDLRVICVGNEIVHFYWRINNNKEWKPTSTGKGSSVDFEFFPEQWRDFIIAEFLKFKIPTGAFDVTWEDDDLNTKPLILEISPTYQLNPKVSNPRHLESYGMFKNTSYFGKNSYVYQYVIQTFNVIKKIISVNHN
jgi:glutathione synthase/RimK-type ligase-like ATP-grasp enzyme